MRQKKPKPKNTNTSTVWIRVELPRPLHKQVRKAGVDLEKSLPDTVIDLLTKALK